MKNFRRTFDDGFYNQYPVSEDGQTCLYLGYTFFRDGYVVSPHGKILKQVKEGRRSGNNITLIVDDNPGRKKRLNAARAIFTMFSGRQLRKNEVVSFKDGDSSNISFDNLEVIQKKELLADHKGRSWKFSESQQEAIRKVYDIIPGATYANLAEAFDCSSNTIQKIINKQYQKEQVE